MANMTTSKIIKKYPPLTMKEVEEFENDYIPRFDIRYMKPNFSHKALIHPNVTLRDYANTTYDNIHEGYNLWIENPRLYKTDPVKIDEDLIPYITSLTVDNISEDSIALKFSFNHGYFVIGHDNKSNAKKCQKFYEKFFHLVYPMDYIDYNDRDFGVPEYKDYFDDDDYIEWEKFENELMTPFWDTVHEEFRIKMRKKLGKRYND